MPSGIGRALILTTLNPAFSVDRRQDQGCQGCENMRLIAPPSSFFPVVYRDLSSELAAGTVCTTSQNFR